MDFDPVGVARHGFVHGVVEHLGKEVMQPAFFRAADIHRGPAAHRFKALQDLDILCRVA